MADEMRYTLPDMKIIIALALLVIPSTVAAQKLDLPTVAFAGGATADWVATYRNMDYWHEQNPMLHWIDHKPKVMVAIGAAGDVAGYLAWHKLTKNKPKLRATGLYAATAVRIFFAARHIRHRHKHLPALLKGRQ